MHIFALLGLFAMMFSHSRCFYDTHTLVVLLAHLMLHHYVVQVPFI
jgi:hypothetical protein